jgi:hypothetical protein
MGAFIIHVEEMWLWGEMVNSDSTMHIYVAVFILINESSLNYCKGTRYLLYWLWLLWRHLSRMMSVTVEIEYW